MSQSVEYIQNYIEFIEQNIKLPLSYDSSTDFREFICNYLDNYRSSIGAIGGMDSSELNKLDSIVDAIKSSITEYYNGHPAGAYIILEKGLYNLHGEIGKLISRSSSPLFRLRLSDGYSNEYSQEEMFHIPFEMRTLVASQRYSIPGLPSIYLGSSIYVCWEELGRPSFNNINVSMYESEEPLRVIDFSYSPSYIAEFARSSEAEEYPDSALKELNQYFIIWPLIATCSVRVRIKNNTFKPEYILPQLVLQYVTKSDHNIDGVKYLSVNNNSSKTSTDLLHNYVFPVKTINSTGVCEVLKDKFKLTKGIPWQIFDIHKNTLRGLPAGESDMHLLNISFEDTPNLPYGSTDFGRFERFLEEKTQRSYL